MLKYILTYIYFSCHDTDIDSFSNFYDMLLDEPPLDELFTVSLELPIEDTDSIISNVSYSSSFKLDSDNESHESDDLFANKAAPGIKRVKVLDPVTEKLQNFLDSHVLSKDNMFYGCWKILLTMSTG